MVDTYYPVPDALVKLADEVRTYDADFSAQPEIAGRGEVVVSAVVSVVIGGPGLTLGTPVLLGGVVQLRISGGTAGTEYLLKFMATTDAGSVLVLYAALRVMP